MKNYFRTKKIPSHSFFPTTSSVSPRKYIERPVNAIGPKSGGTIVWLLDYAR